MSGGHFEYNEYKIRYIADEIQSELDKMGKEISESELMTSPVLFIRKVLRCPR
jgi:hypothetical protein